MDRQNEMLALITKQEMETRQENRRLKEEISLLQEDIETFKKFVALLMRSDRMVFREDEIKKLKKPDFRFEYNISGEPILVLHRERS